MTKPIAMYVVVGALLASVGCSGSNSSSDGGGASAGQTGANGGAGGNGSAGGSSGSGFKSSVDGSKQLGSLSSGDASTLCGELAAYSTSSTYQAIALKLDCGLSGLIATAVVTDMSDAGLQAACKSAYDQCASTISAGVGTTDCTPPDATCTATVAEYTACLNDTIATASSIDIPACNTLTAANINDAYASLQGAEGTSQPASCTAFQAKCPNAGVPDPSTM